MRLVTDVIRPFHSLTLVSPLTIAEVLRLLVSASLGVGFTNQLLVLFAWIPVPYGDEVFLSSPKHALTSSMSVMAMLRHTASRPGGRAGFCHPSLRVRATIMRNNASLYWLPLLSSLICGGVMRSLDMAIGAITGCLWVSRITMRFVGQDSSGMHDPWLVWIRRWNY